MHACADLARRSILRPILGQSSALPGIAWRIDVCDVVSRHRDTLLGGEQCGFADVDQSIDSHVSLYQAAKKPVPFRRKSNGPRVWVKRTHPPRMLKKFVQQGRSE